MKVETEILLNGQEVLTSGSIVAYFDGEVSLSFLADAERIEIDFVLKPIQEKAEQEAQFSVLAARKSTGQRLQITLSMRTGFGGLTTRKPIRVGTAANRELFVSYSAMVITEDAMVLCYTFSLGDRIGG